MKKILSPIQLDACLKKWQKILRLQDWDIDLRILPHAAFAQAGCAGECRTAQEHRSASIHILRPEDYAIVAGSETPDYDMEATLIHELIHVSLAMLEPHAPEVIVEQAVDALARAFSDLR